MENATLTKSVFKPRARIMLQLGDQLIKNESIALLELVKNSYDADARKVHVVMRNIDDPETGTITVEDDGTGMDIDIIKDVWMEPGSDHKEILFNKKNFSLELTSILRGEIKFCFFLIEFS